MKRARARQSGPPYVHRVRMREHELVVDEPDELGGQDRGPTPQELLAARCPVHRTLAGQVSFSERIERAADGATAPAAD